jgi:HK97 family phage portal protein
MKELGRIFGLDFKLNGNHLIVSRAPAQASTAVTTIETRAQPPGPLQPPMHDRGNWWWPIVREPFTGAWQKNIGQQVDTVTSYFAVYACVSLIAGDMGKLRLRLLTETNDGIWQEAPSTASAFWPVLRKPNHFQTRNQFIECWMNSKLLHGNTYVLKERDQRNVVARLYILDPVRTKPLVAPDGAVFYALHSDNLSGIPIEITIPASEIIHDRIGAPNFHPLCGVSPLYAAGLPVVQGLTIQQQSATFFQKGSRPGGVLSSPHEVTEQQALMYKTQWEQNFSGENAGRVAVVGNGMKYEPMGVPAEEAQLIEQLKWTAENVCSVFHVPPYMIGITAPPTYNNVEALQQVYYSQCLQVYLEAIEALLDDGLELGNDRSGIYRTDFDLDDLLRMDTATMIASIGNGMKASIFSPNEARAKFNMRPVRGGEFPLAQQQNMTLEALAQFNEKQIEEAAQPALPPPDDSDDGEDEPPDETRTLKIDAQRLLYLARSLD